MPIVIDTGASCCLTPCRDNFITYDTMKININGLSAPASVVGCGRVRWYVQDLDGNSSMIEAFAYHVPKSDVRLMSPQGVLQQAIGAGRYVGDNKEFSLYYGNESTPAIRVHLHHFNNLPMIWSVLNQKEQVAASMAILDVKLEAYLNVVEPENQNLSAAARELKLWHDRLCHSGMKRIQACMRERKFYSEHKKGCFYSRPPLIKCKHRSTSGLWPCPKSAACCMAKAKSRPAKAKKNQDAPILPIKSGDTSPGDCVSSDQFVSKLPGRQSHTYGKEKKEDMLHGGTIYVDHSAGLVFLWNQVSLRAHETIVGKQAFEQMAADYDVQIKLHI